MTRQSVRDFEMDQSNEHEEGAVDHVRRPLGISLETGATYGAGHVVQVDGVPMLEAP